MKTRRASREFAVQGLYQCDALGAINPELIDEFLQHIVAHPEFAFPEEEDAGALGPEGRPPCGAPAIEVSDFCRALLCGVVENLPSIDAALTKGSTSWAIQRMNRVDRCILRLATYELLFCPDVPVRVILNEAIEIAKDFSGDEGYHFINGVLDGVARLVRGGGSVEER